jgi:hypothetical protein
MAAKTMFAVSGGPVLECLPPKKMSLMVSQNKDK